MKNIIVTYDRWGSGVRFKHGNVYTPEYQPDMDFEDHYFEESRGVWASYSYNNEEDTQDYNTAESLVQRLVDLVRRGGNSLLDIGPDANGKIPPLMEERLLQIGEWMSVNGEAIYGTHRWKWACQKSLVHPEERELYFTSKEDVLFCIFPKYSNDGRVVVRDFSLKEGAVVTFLHTGKSVKWVNDHGNMVFTLPAYEPNKIKAPYAFVLKIKGVPALISKPVIGTRYSSFTATPVVTLTAAIPGAIIRYTTDVSEPLFTSKFLQVHLKYLLH